MNGDKYHAALDAAARQLSYRALSASMLRDKLLDKGHDEQAAEYAVAWLLERGLLDDAAYAESVVRSCARKGYGELRIRQELARRGRGARDGGRGAAAVFSGQGEAARAA